MIKFFSNNKIIFYFINCSLIFLYLYPGSLLGQVIYGSKKIQPQITPDFIISSNHFFAFATLSMITFLTFSKNKYFKFNILYLIFMSIVLELAHIFIPERSFQYIDLFGNLIGVVVSNNITELFNFLAKVFNINVMSTYYVDYFPSIVMFGDILLINGCSFVLIVLLGLIPALKAAKTNPIEILNRK